MSVSDTKYVFPGTKYLEKQPRRSNRNYYSKLSDIYFNKIYNLFNFYVKIMYIFDGNEFWDKI